MNKITSASRIFHLIALLYLSFASLNVQGQQPSTLQPFQCGNGLGYIFTNTEGNRVTSLWSFNLSSDERILIKSPLVAAPPNQFINAVGYNTNDGYLYGNRVGSTQIVRIGANGDMDYLTVSGVSATNASSGDVSADGHLFLYDGQKFVSINLNAGAPDYLVGVLRAPHVTTINDFAFSPVDGNIYGVTSTSPRRLFKFSPSTNTMSIIGNVSGLNDSDNSYGTAFMDNLGNLFIANNNSGKIYRIALPHNLTSASAINATLFSTTMVGLNPGEGARCPLEIIHPAANADTACSVLGSTSPITVNVASNDGAGTFPLDAASVKLINPANSTPATSVTVSGQGTFTLASAGVVTFTPLAGFTGASVQYTITDTQGHTSAPATLTVSICAADLAVTKTVNNSTPFVGSTVTFIITAANAGPAAATGVKVVENIPSGYQVTGVLPSAGSWNAPNWTIGNLAVGASQTLTITAIVKASGVYANTATISGNQPDPNLNNNTATVTPIPVNVIIAVNDLMPSSNGFTGNTNVGNVLSPNGGAADSLNGNPLTISQVNLTTTIGAVPAFTGAPVPSINNLTGQVTIPAGTPAGNYTITYQICEKLNPTNCSTAIVTIPVGAPSIVANPDTFSAVSCNATAMIGNVLGNDVINGTPVNGNATVSVVSGSNSFITIASNGQITVQSGIAPGQYVFTYKICEVINSSNCSNIATITINIVDTVKPVWTSALPTNVTVQCSNIPAPAVLTASDSCSQPVITYNQSTTAGNCPNNYTLIRTWTATDSANNTITHTQTITVTDTTIPVFTGTLPADITVACNAVPTAPTVTATDNCGTATVSMTQTTTTGSCSGNYIITRTWTATDSCGNTATHVQNVTVQDTTAPVVPSAPQDVTVSCPGDVPAMISLTAVDNCSGNITVSGTDTIVPGSCASSYVIIRTWTFTDNCGNTSSVSQTITVNSAANILNKYGIITVSNYFGNSGQTNYAAAIGTTAAFNGVTPGTSLPNGATALHVMGPIMTISGTLNLNNKFFAFNGTPVGGTINAPNGGQIATNPEVANHIAMISPISNELKTLANTSTSYAQFFDGNKVRLHLIPNANGLAVLNLVGLQLNPINEIYFNFGPNLKDVVINVSGTNISIPANQNTNRSDLNNKIIWNFFEATNLALTAKVDGSILAPKAHFSMNHNVEGGVYVNILNQNAKISGFYSGSLNSSAYVINAPAPILNVACASEVPALAPLTATDGCGNTISVPGTDVITAGSCPNSFTIIRTWTVQDPCGYTISASQTINVNDTIAPSFVGTLPANVTVQCSSIPNAPTLTATDNCGTATVSYNETSAPGTCSGSYTLTRTWTATDGCGLTAVHVQTITVQDTTAPTFVEALPANATVECSAIPTAPVLTATDNCGTATVSYAETSAPGTCAGNYILTRTWTATDGCGLTATHVQTITIQDTTAPVFDAAVPADVTVSCGSIPTAVTMTATDSCGNATVSVTEVATPGACAGDSVITRTWTATDSCGNATSISQIITVEDNVAPITNTLFDAVLNVSCDTINTAPDLQFTDSCSSVENTTFDEVITNQTASGYTIIRTWTATDACGNIGTLNQTVNVSIRVPVQTIPSELCIEDLSIDLFTLLDSSIETNGTWVDTNNSGGLNGSTFTPSQVPVGYYLLSYVIPGGDCPRTVEINMNVNDDCIVLPACTINVYNAISPDNDGLNDYFRIDGLDCYPNNSVEIYNRWGVLVYDATGYDNTTKVFRGISEGRVTVKKESELPAGTYFYILKYVDIDGQNREKASYLYLTR